MINWRKKGTISIARVTLAIAFATACTDAAGPNPLGHTSKLTASAASLRPSQSASDRVALDVPGFGGAFVKDGVLNVYLTPDANNAAGQLAARNAIANLLAAGNRPAMPIAFLTARHSLQQLRTWEGALMLVFRRAGVRTAQVDERNNRFEITVASPLGEQDIRGEAAKIGIPAEDLVVRTAEPVVPLVDLNDRVRPAGGGLRINTSVGGCTYGFNAWINDTVGGRYMVTNAHCVQATGFGGVTGEPIYQNTISFSNLVGRVSRNPAATANNVGCASGDVCRQSDAALVSTDPTFFPTSSWDIGVIERTASRGVGPRSSGSTTISGKISLANASTTFFAGDTLEKIGATTGWTAGVVTGTCVYHSDLAGGGRMCNGVVAAGANHGDSGSPVFWKDAQGAYHLMGILWGGPDAVPGGQNSSEFWFSKFQGIQNELAFDGPLTVTPPPPGGTCNPPPGQSCPK